MLSLFYLSFLLFPCQLLAFHFTFNPPSQCDDLGLTWTGGSAPFKLHIFPVFGTPREFSIPDSAFSYGKGSYSVQMPFKTDDKVLLTMSDSTGFNAGGTSNVFIVSQSKGGQCNTTDPGTSFVFQLNSNLQQCRPFLFNGYDRAVPPVTIGAIIPGGSALTITPPPGQPSYSWTVNAARGTSMIFFMIDAQGRQGGSSDIRSVGASDDNSCLDNTSPSSTSDSPSPTQTGLSSSASSKSTSTSTQPVISAASIAAAIIGSVLFLAVVITLALFFLKRKSSKIAEKRLPGPEGRLVDPHDESLYGVPPPFASPQVSSQKDSGSYMGNLALNGRQKYPPSETSFDSPHLSPPGLYPPLPHHSYYSQHSSSNGAAPDGDSKMSPTSYQNPSAWKSWQSSNEQPKYPSAVPSDVPRYITAIDEEEPSPYDGGFIEVPPQYSAGQGNFNSSMTDIKPPL